MTARAVVEENETLRPAGRLWTAGMLALGAVVLAAYSSFRKPLWIDEFLHFALGGLSFGEAWDVVTATTVNVNHGQTGVYMMLDWLLLQVFGASSVALRLPSLVAAAGLLTAGVWFLRLKGCSPGWQLVGLVALGAQTTLMYHAGEARPYMPMAASTVGMLAYYSVSPEARSSARVRLLGACAFVLGALVHPYFPLMLGLVAVVSVWLFAIDRRIRLSFREGVRFLNPGLLLLATVGYITVGTLTWMRGSPRFSLDPFISFGGPASMVLDFFARHLEFILGVPVVAVLAAWTALAVSRCVPCRRPIAGPLALMAIGLASSAFVSLASVVRDYWVFPRQWVAGAALVALGAVWVYAKLHAESLRAYSASLRLVALSFVAVVVVAFTLSIYQQVHRLHYYAETWAEAEPASRPGAGFAIGVRIEQGEWVRLANVNVKEGGGVWSELAEFYEARRE